MARKLEDPKGERFSWWARSNFCPMTYAHLQDGNRRARGSYSSRYDLSITEKQKKHKDEKSQSLKVRRKLNLECSDESEGA